MDKANPTLGSCRTAEELASVLAHLCDRPREEKGGWKVCCPSHDDKNPSLSITHKDDKVMLHCFAGCETQAILTALGLVMQDLYVQDTPMPKTQRRIACTYDYRNLDGDLLYQKVRYEPKGFDQRRPNPAKPGAYIYNLDGVQKALYHLPEVMEAIALERPIFLVEGEKDAETLTSHGLTATSGTNGASYWSEDFTATLEGAHVVILPDYDEAGQKGVAKIAVALLPVVASLKIIHAFHTAQLKSDVSDWFAAGGTREEFDAFVENAPYWTGDEGPIPLIAPLPRALAPLMPPLPRAAAVPESLAVGAAPWLEMYEAYSRLWAPRAAAGFHQAVGLWVLSTVAARRICVEFGSPIYPVLFLSLAAESTIYTKSTAVAQGETLLRHAGCTFFLAPNHTTPQALIRNMGGRVPQEYAEASEEDRVDIRQKLAFSGQRGWYYAEWGGMLSQMHRTESPMAMFHELIRRLDDDAEEFSSETIQRGLERITAPYLSLLTSSTPHDLAPFMTQGAKWWHDGFWPRFAFIVPDGPPVTTRRPQGRGTPPSALTAQLHTWHTSLGMPTVDVDEVLDKHDRPTGDYRLQRSPFPCQTLSVDAATEEAYNCYGEALWTMDIPRDLIPSYARLQHKALRIATLLASIHGKRAITMPYWAYAQKITESWRGMLHRVLAMMGEQKPMSADAQAEDKIELILAQEGPQTLRLLQRRLHLESAVIKRLSQSMEFTGRIVLEKRGKAVYACVPGESTADEEGEQSEG